ncbi:glycosyltransferase family 4 protein [Streptomyces sp. NPDC090493]|uniref:glycosyltransferase family 4 protein n=1 Tax=Streptomyces sp. NPDC090493 TaxID=3365964 RepID=UPI0038078EB2
MYRQQAGLDDGVSSRQARRMHIGLVHWSFPPCVGGVETHLWEYSQALLARGHRVTVFVGTGYDELRSEGLELRRHPLLDLSVPRYDSEHEVQELRAWFRAELTPSSGPIRLVHGHNLHHFSSVPARALKSLQQELGLVLPHTYHAIWRTPQDERLARMCAVWDVHHAVSDFLVRECAEVLRQPVDRTYLGVNTKTYLNVAELSEISARPTILLPARLIPNKGAVVAVKALKQIIKRSDTRRPRLVLTDPVDIVDFCGERNGFRAELADLISACGLSQGSDPDADIEFRPAQLTEMAGLYAEAAVVIYPSRFGEPMGLAPLEAMCAARPVIVTKLGGLIENGSVFSIPGGTEDAVVNRLAQEVLRLLEEPERARLAGAAAREHILAEFDLGHVYVEPMLAEYERLLARRPAALAA